MELTTIPSTLDQFLAQSADLHKHLCPRQVLGARMGMLAGELLGLELPQVGKRLLAFVETDGCFADGVAVATGCWLGRRTMRLVDYGKVAATFVDTRDGRALRIRPRTEARGLARAYAPAAKSHWHAYLEAYQLMGDDELLEALAVDLTIDLRALVSRPGVRTTCARCGEEIINERELLVGGEVRCRGCVGENYYR